MLSWPRVAAHISFACLVLAFVVPPAHGDIVSEAVGKVSLGQYRVYQVDIQDMGLGLYGGPAYDQGYRSRDGWSAGVYRIDPNWTEGGTPGNLEARLYLVDQLQAMGLEVSVQGNYRNVVAELKGSQRPTEIYIVSAHYDTTSNGEKPGGDDNASGTAGVLEAARVLTQFNTPATLRFIAFNAEEDWMLGSQEYVSTVVVPRGENIIGVLNLDMILRPGWDSDPQAPIDLDVETRTTENCLAWAYTFMDAIATYVPSLVVDAASPSGLAWDAGDQGPFIAAGYPALMIAESTAQEIWSRRSNVYYHQPGDASDGLANDPLSPSGVTYDYEFATDVVRATVATLALEAEITAKPSPTFFEYQAIPTDGAQDIESFTIGDDHYLAIANAGAGLTHDVPVDVYRWDGTVFAKVQSIPAHGASHCEFFALNGGPCLAIANMRDDATYAVDSRLYRWNGTTFAEFQSLATQGAADCEFFTIADRSYLAVANSRSDDTYDARSSVYRWNGTAFTEFLSIATHGALDCEFFTIDGDSFLAFANSRNDETYSGDLRIYKWNGTVFAGFQSLATQGASGCEFFAADGAAFLAVASSGDETTAEADSHLYKWDGSSFVTHQFVPTQGIAGWESFTVGDDSYLAAANRRDGVSLSVDSRIYKWNGTRLVEWAVIPTHGASDLESFRIDGVPFLAVANGGTATGHDAASVIYRYETPATPKPVQ